MAAIPWRRQGQDAPPSIEPAPSCGPSTRRTLRGWGSFRSQCATGTWRELGSSIRVAVRLEISSGHGGTDEPHAQRGSLWSADSQRPALSSARNQRQAALPNARGPFNGAQNSRGPRAEPPRPVDSRPILPRGTCGASCGTPALSAVIRKKAAAHATLGARGRAGGAKEHGCAPAPTWAFLATPPGVRPGGVPEPGVVGTSPRLGRGGRGALQLFFARCCKAY